MYTTVVDFLLHVHPSKVEPITLFTRIIINFKWTPYKFDAIYSYETFCILFQNWITIKWHKNICPLHRVGTVDRFKFWAYPCPCPQWAGGSVNKFSDCTVYYYIAVRRWQTFLCPLLYMYLINVGRICLSIQNDEFQPWRKNNSFFKVEIHHILYLNVHIYMHKMYMELYRGA